MKKYLVIGNPIEHSLSPKLHNYWLSRYKVGGNYEKKLLTEDKVGEFVKSDQKISGINVTVPFKKTVINYCTELTKLALTLQSVNTITLSDNKIIGDNTDVYGFEQSLIDLNFNGLNKTAYILGAGGVVSSIVIALNKLGVKNIFISNRTKNKAEALAKEHNLVVSDWGKIVDFDIIINCTSIGLKQDDSLGLDFSNVKDKIFYDIIYKPKTKFLVDAEKLGNKTVDGKMMFLYQAQKSFEIWHGIKPEINEKVINLLND
ncbi:MAG: shikimate dehydrogenase [Pelagibacteraceae bacterium TMED136]|nr:MAG: shikimate dehydrogenase [Pelagibacteraceae bacterium TMED136]|tara:strand:- start:2124 stop:2903 length:780 start_codon:yes stop_codon:yes gene_type:complete